MIVAIYSKHRMSRSDLRDHVPLTFFTGETLMSKKRMLLASLIAASYCAMPVANADEHASRFYEDDAWYDVSEWFDGNDYNPTDEAIGRWDNETFEYADNLSSTDQDNDDINDRETNYGDYGYANDTNRSNTSSESNASSDDRWFYDYYDDGSSQQSNQDGMTWFSLYQDTNDDGVYDSYTRYRDTDNDGIYDAFTYYSFDSAGDQNQQAKSEAQSKQKDLSSKTEQVAGEIDRIKTVDVRGRDHIVAFVKNNDGKATVVDLGVKQESNSLSQGDKLTASGHRMKVGDKSILIATKAKTKSSDLTIDRNGRKYTGNVASTREVTVQGKKHLLAKVKTDNGKSMMVDLGPKDQLSKSPRQGDKVTVQGVPVKVNDRIVLMARTLGDGENQSEIKRKQAKSKS
tara:strand:- start:776 stop:1978 length:1203 start_codon:yes stop_codon:yes gene_type:complete